MTLQRIEVPSHAPLLVEISQPEGGRFISLRFDNPGDLDQLIAGLIEMRNRRWPWPPIGLAEVGR